VRPLTVGLVVVAVVASVAAVVFAGLYFTNSEDETSAAEQCEGKMFGRISELTRDGEQYEMRFDPSFLTTGVTANTAAAEDGVVQPGEPVPNDNYEIDEGKRKLTYIVPPDAAVTVLTNNGSGIMSTPVTVAELAELVDGGKPVDLFEPLSTGFWMRTHVDTVCTLDQQYKP
jgi:type II secretory pathway pseudopilin PulG